VATQPLLLALRAAELGVEQDDLLLVLPKRTLQRRHLFRTLLFNALQLGAKALDHARLAALGHELRLQCGHLLRLRFELLRELLTAPSHLGNLARRVALQALVGGLHLILHSRQDRQGGVISPERGTPQYL
jgi:hypothetical protein